MTSADKLDLLETMLRNKAITKAEGRKLLKHTEDWGISESIVSIVDQIIAVLDKKYPKPITMETISIALPGSPSNSK